MPQRIVKQPNGLYAVWSTVVDDFVLIEATPQEIIDYWTGIQRTDVTQRVLKVTEELSAGGKPYHQFTDSFDECLATIRAIHGPDAESLKMFQEPVTR